MPHEQRNIYHMDKTWCIPKRQCIIHKTDSECHITQTLPHGIITASNYTRKAHGILNTSVSVWYRIPHRQRIAYHTSARYIVYCIVSPWNTALLVHGIPHCQCMVFHRQCLRILYHAVCAWYTRRQCLHGVPHRQCTVFHQQLMTYCPDN
jgi:hypothetical protein